MAGYPTRPSRSAFGPRNLTNRRPPRDADKELTAEQMMLAFWQLAGLGLCGDRAWVLFTCTATPALIVHGEAWDPDGQMVPTVEQTSTGIYVVTYPATVQNEQGQDVTLDLRAAEAIPQSSTANIVGVAAVTSGRIVTMKTTTANTGAAVDPTEILVKIR